jgi:hypothetical protein
MAVRRAWIIVLMGWIGASGAQTGASAYQEVEGNPVTTQNPVSWAQCPPGRPLHSGGFHGVDVMAMPEESAPDNTPPHQNSWRVKSKAPGAAYAVCEKGQANPATHAH